MGRLVRAIKNTGGDALTARWFVVVLALFACAEPNTRIENPSPEALAVAKQPGSNFDASDFPEGEGRSLVVANCTACHSDKLVRQNRSTKEGWRELIRWMQKKQGLWLLDPQTEDTIVEYLASHYGRPAVADDTRRPALPDHLLPPGSP
jgi:cytochrome c5